MALKDISVQLSNSKKFSTYIKWICCGCYTARRTNMNVLPNLEFEDFTPDELENAFRLWGLGPGQKSVFTAVDGYTDD
ncbi:hypothetical protein G6F56_013533 [Rhizopus delemar]|nr:hypothetical protein G6F56_013533 [Rhizopus delemar]